MDIAAKLETARRELLDLSLRNPLLNHRPGKARGLRIVDELPAEVHRILWDDGATMAFTAAASDADGDAEQAPSDLPPPPEPEARHQDRKLQTAHSAERLQTRLIATARDARFVAEEQGVNVLYLALGFLRWREADAAANDPWRAAPLYLVPVQLARASAGAQFLLTAADAEPSGNLTLQVKLKTEFGISLPDPPVADGLDLNAWFATVQAAVAARSGWTVEPRIALDLFSFGRYLMYRDLDPAAWPAGQPPAERPLVRKLFAGGFAPLPPAPDLDRERPPERIGEVVESDASQAEALAAVAAGADLVIQGPPGTGKSQTICNLIAEAVAQGRTVLFVAEKMAALSVVQRRLQAVGLGDLCLELHSDKAQKKAVAAELGRTLRLDAAALPAEDGSEAAYIQTRAELNALAEALRAPVGGSGLTPGEALDRLADLPDGLPRLADLPELTPELQTKAIATAGELQAALARTGPLAMHPFGGCRLTQMLPADEERLRQTQSALASALPAARSAGENLARALGVPAPASPAAWAAHLACARHHLARPAAAALALPPELPHLMEQGRAYAALRAQHDAVLIPEAWDQDLVQVRADLASYGEGFFRVLSGAWRNAANRLKGLCRGAAPKDHAAQMALVDAVLAARRLAAEINGYDALGRQVFASAWRGAASDWAALEAGVAWARTWAQFPPCTPGPEVATVLAGAQTAETALRPALDGLAQQLRWDGALAERGWEALTATAAARPDLAQDVCTANRAAEGLPAPVVALARSWDGAAQGLAGALRCSLARDALDRALATRPELARFDAAAHARLRSRFTDLDRRILARNRLRIGARHRGQLPQVGEGAPVALLRREAEKKIRHLPIRSLLKEAGAAVQRTKPVFLMSPLSVAAYLEPGGLTFDLIVFDEASQVRPVDAVGALARGHQAVVVGDSRQMPPTSFFDRLVAGDEDGESVTADLESVLGLFLAAGCPDRWLQWHYRSRHPSLIAVSNAAFYEGRLRVFPSPAGSIDPAGDGLSLRHLPQAVYDRAKSRTNPVEAAAVAAAVIEHARTRPQQSLGVAAFSQAQMEAIANAVERARRTDASCEAFFAAHPNEPFFVKNLENVQGDERDCILISVGYGRDSEGQVALNFGPLNADGGERRLNVLITRARRRMVVFTNLQPEDLDPRRTQAKGLLTLREFLACARDGRLPGVAIQPVSGIAARIGSALAERKPERIGEAGIAWRLGTVGVALDDATWTGARCCRDRERLGDEVLTGLGWDLRRTWRLAWWRRPEDEQAKLNAKT